MKEVLTSMVIFFSFVSLICLIGFLISISPYFALFLSVFVLFSAFHYLRISG